mgnify:FL=1
MKTFSKFVLEEKDPSEYDNEGRMAEGQLTTIIDAAEDLIDMIEDEDNLPEWCQSKITKATDYIDSVRDYMKSDKRDDANESFEFAFGESADEVIS